MQPALAGACDNCRRVTDDHYAVGDRIICAGCWDPFGLPVRRSRVGIDGKDHGMLEGHKKSGPGGIGSANRDLSRNTSTAVTGGDGPMIHPTHIHPTALPLPRGAR